MTKYYFTFGADQYIKRFGKKVSLKGFYTIIIADSWDEAQRIMAENWGIPYSFNDYGSITPKGIKGLNFNYIKTEQNHDCKMSMDSGCGFCDMLNEI